jgi:polar amino acid transport system substrate-binding protein
MQALPVPRADRTHRPRRVARRRLAVAASGLAWALTHAVNAIAQVAVPAPAAVLTLHYQERPPYSQSGPDGHVHGLLAVPATRACQKAQLSCAWTRTPGQRQLALIQTGQGWDCGLGWYRNPEREALGRFSAPLYQDRPFMALARRGTAWEAQRGLTGLLSDAALPLLVKEGYSYGPLLDGLIALHAGQVRRTSAESQQMVRMVEAGRAGWMIVAPEEAEVLLADPGAAGAPPQLKLHPLPGVPAGQTRHLYCNKAVPEAVVERLNRALAER